MNNPLPIPDSTEHDNLMKEKEEGYKLKQQQQEQSTERSYNPDGLYNSEVPDPNEENDQLKNPEQQPDSE